MDLKDKKILVIGGAGLIGSHVVEALLEEKVREVVVYDNFSRGTRENLFTALRDPCVSVFPLGGDILQTDLLEQAFLDVDGVFHLAALWLLHCHEYPVSAFEVNVRGTFNVLEACRKHQVKKLIYSSSASVYGDAVQTPMTEEHPYHNWTFYGATKISGEHMMKAYHRRYGLSGIGLRYMNVYGPRQDYRGAYIAVMMKMLDAIDRNEAPVIYGDGSQTYDFIHVEDVARANICAMKSDCAFGFFNVGRGIKTTLNELADILLDLTQKKHLGVKHVPSEMSFVTHRVGSTESAKKNIGFEWRLDLVQGMKSLIEWRNAQKV